MSTPARSSAYLDRQLAAITRYSPADREALLAFRRAAYSPSSVFCDPGYLRWSVERSPAALEGRVPLWLYRSEGKIEGQQRVLPVGLKIGALTRAAAWNMDLFVNPAFQLRGIGHLLQQVAFAETGLSLALEVSEEARKSYLRAGWRDLGTVPLYTRPLEAKTMIAARSELSIGPAGSTLVGLGTVALRAADLALERALVFSSLRPAPQERFDVRANALWRAVSPHYPVIATRDYETLSWRFDQYPKRDRYQRVYFFRGRQLAGYVVLRAGQWNGIEAGFIVDYLCAPGDTGVVLAHAIAFLRRGEPDAIYCLHCNPVSTLALKLLGFFARDSGWHLMARAQPDELPMVAKLFDPRQWFITLGDSDVDRPREGTRFPRPAAWRPSAAAPAARVPAPPA